MHRRQVYYYYESLIMGWACQFRKWKKQGKGELRTATLQLAYYYNAFFVLYSKQYAIDIYGTLE